MNPRPEDEPTPKPLGREEVRAALQKACAIVHGYGKGMSLLQLVSLILEQGLPDEATRAEMLAAKLADTGNTRATPPRTRLVVEPGHLGESGAPRI